MVWSSENSEVSSIQIDYDICFRSTPCRHNVTVEYENGYKYTKTLTGSSIVALFNENPGVSSNVDILIPYHTHLFKASEKQNIVNIILRNSSKKYA